MNAHSRVHSIPRHPPRIPILCGMATSGCERTAAMPGSTGESYAREDQPSAGDLIDLG
jgi:hypothetical protein